MNILIVGSGYVGLVTGACFAEMGHQVFCLDIDKLKIDNLNKGKLPFFEPGLDELVKRNNSCKRLIFTTDYKSVQKADIAFIAVPTPSAEDGCCNTTFVQEAAKQLAANMTKYLVVVNKSTVPVGSAFLVKEIITKELANRTAKIDFDVVSNPEFLKEGSAVQDCMRPDRIVVGADSEKALVLMREVYSPFMLKTDRFIEMDILSSEMTKYAANAMLATRISFMNEIAEICKKVGANVNEVRKGIGSDSRIGYSFLYAGIGYGGSCFPKDIKALCHTATQVGVTPHLLQAVDSINNRQKKVLAHNIISYFSKNGGVKGKTIAVWGLSFKPDTDDMREAPSLSFIEHLLKEGAILRLYDPISMEKAKTLLESHPNMTWCESEFDAAKGSDAIALLTEWKQFRVVDFGPILKNMNHPAIFDGRNQYHPKEMRKKGFNYIGIGVPDHIN
ncbi:MAG: UDP-glucose/GDP-mannose dehydrogenase family protein [Chlamydiae bacterium]|nr:UDP-glucose/GDP-mannose dehydrogenase family protein [Chlamydiota bacterium]